MKRTASQNSGVLRASEDNIILNEGNLISSYRDETNDDTDAFDEPE